MKKILAVALTALFVTAGAFAESKKDSGALGIGLTNGVSTWSNYSVDKMKINLFLDYGSQLLGPIYIGGELNANVQKVGEDSATSSYLTASIRADSNGVYWTKYTLASQTYKVNYWNIDISPRAYASLELTDMIMGQAFLGFNKNLFSWDSKVIDNTNGQTVAGSVDSGVLSEEPWQLVMGLRGTLSYFYLDYTRYFDLGKSKITWNAYASDRITIGASFRF